MHYCEHSDETLVMLTLAGEQNAYEVLVEKYQNAVVAAALSVTRNGFMAEDAAQDAFVTAWMKLNTLREPSKFGGWVCRIAKNCALNTVTRYRSYLPIDTLENTIALADSESDPAVVYALSKEQKELDDTIGRLPERIRQIITLHYFEGMSVADIADRMRISVGTVKSQLHDGRKRMRKELCAMNEKWNDTLVQRVMKKVEELKMWQLKNSKEGFEAVYEDVLRDIGELPECMDKNHALADVLMRGWWWLPGTKNDALFERIRDAAEKGKNDDVMAFIVAREDSRVAEGARLEFIRDKQIPRLEKAGFTKTLAREWFWLAREYYKANDKESGSKAYQKVKALCPPTEIFHALADRAEKLDIRRGEMAEKDKRKYRLNADSSRLHYVDNQLRFWEFQSIGAGWFYTFEAMFNILRTASLCDGRFFVSGFSAGESYKGSDGSTLTYVSDCEKAVTPCGVFDGCQLWRTDHYEQYSGRSVFDTYYKEGVGIVKQTRKNYGVSSTVLLKSYKVKGGQGILHVGAGNSWEYVLDIPSDVITFDLELNVSYADESRVIISSYLEAERTRYDENSWADMMRQIRHEYCDHKDALQDVSHAVERALCLAETPIEKAHTKAAVSTVKRIFETDDGYSPERKQSGHWNFFHKNHTHCEKGCLHYEHNSDWSFEWKIGPWNNANYPLLYNDVYGILQDAVNCIWSDEWKAGAAPLVEYCLWGRRNIRTQIICTTEESVSTKAGEFKNCLKLSLDIKGMDEGWSYRGGKHDYYFAEGIGIVKTVTEYCGGSRRAVYELTEYIGSGEGYMPVKDGLFRKYEAVGLTDGYVGEAEYTYVADGDGEVFIITERTGIRNIPSPISCYSSIEGEVKESRLWNEKKREESRLRHDVNNFNLILHYLGRPGRYYAAPKKALEWGRHSLKMMEFLGEGNGVPPAWMGRYGEMLFRTACFIFGNGGENKEEGYELLEKAFQVYLKWSEIPAGTPLDVGNEYIYGGIKLLKDKSMIRMPDGTVEAIEYGGILELNAKFMYRALTAERGWEWFNSVRNEERYKAYTEKIKEYADREDKS